MCVICIQGKVIKQGKIVSNKQKADGKGPDMKMITQRFPKFINQYA